MASVMDVEEDGVLDDFSLMNPNRSNRVLERFGKIIEVSQVRFSSCTDKAELLALTTAALADKLSAMLGKKTELKAVADSEECVAASLSNVIDTLSEACVGKAVTYGAKKASASAIVETVKLSASQAKGIGGFSQPC